MIPKPPKEFCIDSFAYQEYDGLNSWSEPKYKEPVFIEHCRIDRGSEYSSTASGKQLLYNALIFCYEEITTPLPEFKAQSKVIFDETEHTIIKVIPIYEPYQKTLYSYEIEVV